jgi:hypothetical protein
MFGVALEEFFHLTQTLRALSRPATPTRAEFIAMLREDFHLTPLTIIVLARRFEIQPHANHCFGALRTFWIIPDCIIFECFTTIETGIMIAVFVKGVAAHRLPPFVRSTQGGIVS